ncbi:MAG: MgtC/SapB family protein [Gemmatimonadaceae bacterium]
MPLHPTWDDIAIRLILTMIAGGVIGFNRSAQGHNAGFRTTILVGLAAAVAMIQANVLLSVGGRLPGSFGSMDVLRLPLGILTGVGFIGGGTILKRGSLVTGVTTAATLWVMTAIGLCFGGGQMGLGVTATVLSLVTLWALKWLDVRIPRERFGTLVIESDIEKPVGADLVRSVASLGFRAALQQQSKGDTAQHNRLAFEISWKRPETAGPPLDLLDYVNGRYPVISFTLISDPRH